MRLKNRQDLEESIPDYAFNKMDEESAKDFEKSIQNYPDLIEEIADIKKVFAKVDSLNYNEKLAQKSVDISFKVGKRLELMNQKGSGYVRYLALATGLIGMALIAVLTIKPFQNNNDLISKSEYSILSPKEVFAILGDSAKISDIEESAISNIAEIAPTDSGYIATLDETIDETSKSFLTKGNATITLPNLETSADPYAAFDNVSDDELQSILQELKNEKFPS